MPTCRDMSELVTDYMEHATSLHLRLSMWLHLSRCEACRHYYDQVRRTVALLGRGQATPPGQGTEDTLLATVQGSQQRDS